MQPLDLVDALLCVFMSEMCLWKPPETRLGDFFEVELFWQ
jgi:hypothetical protein